MNKKQREQIESYLNYWNDRADKSAKIGDDRAGIESAAAFNAVSLALRTLGYNVRFVSESVHVD